MSLGTRLFTLLFGELVGSDEFGNSYYVDRRKKGKKRERRWVLYADQVEASRVPAEWHAWLHSNLPAPPVTRTPQRPWQLSHQPNQTGTHFAYRPPGHTLQGGKRAAAAGDYEPWQPA